MNPVHNVENLRSGYLEDLAELPDVQRRRFLHGEFVKPEGAVFSEYSGELIDKVPRCERYIVGIDMVTYAAVLIGLQRYTDKRGKIRRKIYCVDEWQRFGAIAHEANEVITNKWGKKYHYRAYIDHNLGEAGTREFDHSELAKKGQGSVDAGISELQTAMHLGDFYVSQRCKLLHYQLQNYRRDENGVIIREDDHLCLDGNTKIITPYGKHLLKNIKIGDTVLTCGGWGKVLVSGCTNIEAETYKVKLCCGKQLTGTADHLIATSNGWARLKDLRKGSEIIVCQSREMKSHIKGYGSGDILNQIVWKTGDIIGRMPVILKRVLSHFTEKYGKIITDKYQRACTYIISMVMQLITGLKILKCYHTQNMEEYIMQGNVRKNKGNTLSEYDRKQRNGMGVKKGNYGIAN